MRQCGMHTSDRLVVGTVYTRNELIEKFGIKDSTIKNGIFQPKGHDSIWLFVTRDKTPDRTQYADELNGDDLYIDGQNSGRTDAKLIHHESNGVEVILFYRSDKNENPGYGFHYEGRFKYVDHKGLRPAHFHFRRI
jgi:hypothetical protein